VSGLRCSVSSRRRPANSATSDKRNAGRPWLLASCTCMPAHPGHAPSEEKGVGVHICAARAGHGPWQRHSPARAS
jgi:hypothetical protein